MLTSEIKRKIDNARDILVGKVPVPSQQIEQITIALIYKFMSDIDQEDKKLGGEWFFVWEYNKYSRFSIMDRKIWGQERLNLYTEWLEKMGINPHLPQMFRDIFRNAYLPFKDPSTLDMFLKQIDEFSYDHSEDLWDAFEYLLSTAWSQWDAGQFRTPRHIIDFIVSVVEPQLSDTVLDPACGTAWFLISAYKYIMAQHGDKKPWDKLSISQKKALTENFVWYDISYEMVRLSLVNMYLHNFWNPKIYEYDTLSSDDRRDDRFDCILANPPFMTPKWWIQPHNRFSIKANKSEVLFVDYIIDHLNPRGKAWVIVPEGIIFQWANAYKSLREKMVKENYLWAVVSLPAGVFQPYSGVKTSILLFDKELAKKTNKILFVKVENDGFSLWAQRKEISQNDLPKATEILLNYKQDLIAWNEVIIKDSKKVLLVEKEKIWKNGDYNLSMDRYRESFESNSDYEMVKLGDVCELKRWITYSKKDEVDNDWHQVLRANNIDLGSYSLNLDDIKTINKNLEVSDDKKLKKNDIFICLASWSKEHIWKVAFIESDTNYYFGWFMWAVRTFENIKPKYLFYCLTSWKFNLYLRNSISWVNINNLNANILYNYEIPLPDLETQEKIVAELEKEEMMIENAKQSIKVFEKNIQNIIDEVWGK